MSRNEECMLSESCHPVSDSDVRMTEEDQEEGARQPRLRHRPLGDAKKPAIKKFFRQDDQVKIDDLGKRIMTLAEENHKRLIDENSDDSFERSINKRLKQESNFSTRPIFRGVPKVNNMPTIQPLVLRNNSEFKRAFPIFEDKVIFRGEDKLGFSSMLKKHRHDNDDDTSSEDMALGKKLILDNLLSFVSTYVKKPVPKITLKRSESNKSTQRCTTPSNSTVERHKSAKRSKSAAKNV